MASRDLGMFSLRILEIGRTTSDLSLKNIYEQYKELYGYVAWDTFQKRVTDANSAGYFGLAGGSTSSNTFVAGSKRWTSLDGRTIDAAIDRLKEMLWIDLLKSSNRQLFDALLRHQIMLLKLDKPVRDRIYKLLEMSERDLADQIARRLDEGGRSLLGTQRLKLLEEAIKKTRLKAWDEITEEWIKQLIDIAQSEVKTIKGISQTASPVELDLALPTASALRVIVISLPFEGRTLKQWADNIAENDIKRIMDQIKIGLVQGESGAQIARRVVGTAALKYKNGVTEIARKEAASITRTAISAITNMVREEFYLMNSEIFENERYVSVLDSRTTPQCRSLDGKIFAVGEGPQPPLHFNCRSVRIPYFDSDTLHTRPAKEATEKQLLRDFAKKEGLEPDIKKRADLPFGYKGLFDEFAQEQVRRMTSIVPSEETYQTWLMRQPKQFVEDVLGPTRARLFRTGQLTLDKFVDTSGKTIRLSQLAKRHAEAFRAAGLDPEGFL